MNVIYTDHARARMQLRQVTEAQVESMLDHAEETYLGVAATGVWVYHKRFGRRRVYVLVEPFSDPPVIVSVAPRRPVMREL